MVPPVAEGLAVAFRAAWRLPVEHHRIRFRGPTNMWTFQIRMTADDHTQACLHERPGSKTDQVLRVLPGTHAVWPYSLSQLAPHFAPADTSSLARNLCSASRYVVSFSPSSSANKSQALRSRRIAGMSSKMTLPPQALSLRCSDAPWVNKTSRNTLEVNNSTLKLGFYTSCTGWWPPYYLQVTVNFKKGNSNVHPSPGPYPQCCRYWCSIDRAFVA